MPFLAIFGFLAEIARNQPKKIIKLLFYLLLLVIFQLLIPRITCYNLRYCSESSLLAVVLSNSAKVKHQQHIFTFLSVTSLLHLYWIGGIDGLKIDIDGSMAFLKVIIHQRKTS